MSSSSSSEPLSSSFLDKIQHEMKQVKAVRSLSEMEIQTAKKEEEEKISDIKKQYKRRLDELGDKVSDCGDTLLLGEIIQGDVENKSVLLSIVPYWMEDLRDAEDDDEEPVPVVEYMELNSYEYKQIVQYFKKTQKRSVQVIFNLDCGIEAKEDGDDGDIVVVIPENWKDSFTIRAVDQNDEASVCKFDIQIPFEEDFKKYLIKEAEGLDAEDALWKDIDSGTITLSLEMVLLLPTVDEKPSISTPISDSPSKRQKTE